MGSLTRSCSTDKSENQASNHAAIVAQVSADLLDRMDLLSPEETATLRAQRAKLTATETALKLHLQQNASHTATATASAATGNQNHMLGTNQRPAQPLHPIPMGPSNFQNDPWDSAGSQLRSAAAGTCGQSDHGLPSDSRPAGARGSMSGVHPGGCFGASEQHQSGSAGPVWGAGGSGAWHGSAGKL